jgi:hypothetical protein
MFFAYEVNQNGDVVCWAAASEMKALVGITNWTSIIPFPPGRYLSIPRKTNGVPF